MGLDGYIPKQKISTRTQDVHWTRCVQQGKGQVIFIYRLSRDNFDCHRGNGVAELLLPCSQGSYDIPYNKDNLLQLRII